MVLVIFTLVILQVESPPLRLDRLLEVINEALHLVDNVDLDQLFLILLTGSFDAFNEEVQGLLS